MFYGFGHGVLRPLFKELKKIMFSNLLDSVRLSLLIIFAISALSGCGSSGSSSDSSSKQGTFVDSAVSGIKYQTPTQSGFTDSNGLFKFLENEEITLSIGGITLGNTTASTVITPVNMVSNAKDHSNESVLKILQFLQTLDTDQDPTNGIQISEAARNAAANLQLNFDTDSETTIGNIIKQMTGDNRSLLSAAQASIHFTQSLFIIYTGTFNGEWVDNGEIGSFTFDMTADGQISNGSWISAQRSKCELNGRIDTAGSIIWTDCDGDTGTIQMSLLGGISCAECIAINRTISGKRTGLISFELPSQPACKTRAHSLLPPLTGGFCVGLRDIHLTDTSRLSAFTEESNNQRELMLRVWYPTDTTSTGDFSDYMDQVALTGMIKTFKLQDQLSLTKEEANAQIKPQSILNAPIATSQEKYPVLLFSPGLQFVTATYTTFLEQLASHGYIVVAINHSYVSGDTVIPGSSTSIPVSSDISGGVLTDAQFNTVVQDSEFVLSQLLSLNNSDVGNPSFTGHLNLDQMGMFGHSIGGAVALQMCAQQSLMKACSNMDGVPLGANKSSNIGKPVLAVRSVVSLNDTKFDDFYNAQNVNAFSLRIAGTLHSNFSDGPLMIRHFIPTALNNSLFEQLLKSLIGVGKKDPLVVTDIVNQMHLHFFNHFLQGKSKAKFLSVAAGFYKDPQNNSFSPGSADKIFTAK